MVQFMVPEQQHGGKLAPKARLRLHLGVSPKSKGWEVLDLTNNKVVTTVKAIFYETMSLEAWKAEHGLVSTWKPAVVPTDPSSTTTPLLAVEDDNVEDVPPPFSPTSNSPLPLAADLPKTASPLATSDEGSIAALPSASAYGISGGRRDEMHLGGQVQKPPMTRDCRAEESAEVNSAEEPTAEEKSADESTEAKSVEEPTTEEKSAGEPTLVDHLDGGASTDVVEVLGGEEGELLVGEQPDDSNVVEVPIEEVKSRRSTVSNLGKPAEKLSYHAYLSSTSYSTLLDDAAADVDLPELDPDMHADPEHCWDVANMTVKELMASWKGKAVKAAMDEEIKSLIANGTWELVYGADYDETYAQVGNYVTLRIFLSIVSVLDLHLMQLHMKNALLQSKLDCLHYMYQTGYYNDGTGQVCKMLKSLYGLKQSPWYSALDAVLTGVDWQKSQVDEALYFKVGVDGVVCWVLVYVDDLLAASSSLVMLKELLEAAFKQRKISPVEKYLGLIIVRDRSARKLWLHQ
ncbi:unnamed protein product [Closterium sp. NIES-53]